MILDVADERIMSERVIVDGEYDLAASAKFRADITRGSGECSESGVVRFAFPMEGTWSHAGALARQRAPGVVDIEVWAPASGGKEVAAQVRRILSLDLDGGRGRAVADGDGVTAAIRRRHPGLRPVLFHSPYEAACWAVVCHRLTAARAASIKRWLTERHGVDVMIAGVPVRSFPAPDQLRRVTEVPGLAEQKRLRFAAIAEAAMAGELDATVLRAMPPSDAVEHLRRLPGIGPFSAELIMARGAGHPEVFPVNEPHVITAMSELYGARAPDEVEQIVRRWPAYRGWMAHWLRVSRQARAEIGER